MEQIVCRWCGATQPVDTSRPGPYPCQSCGNPLLILQSATVRCVACGTRVPRHERTRDRAGRSFCRACLDRLAASPPAGAPVQTSPAEVIEGDPPDLSWFMPGIADAPEGEGADERQVICPKCYHNVTAYQPLHFGAQGTIVCPFCKAARRERWARLLRRWGPVVGVAVLGVITAFLLYLLAKRIAIAHGWIG